MLDNSFYTFIVLSTINTTLGKIDTSTRFAQTLDTLNSIRDKVPNSKIVFIDNSIDSLTSEQTAILKSQVDVFKAIDHNLFTLAANYNGLKGEGELYLMYEAIKLIKQHNLISNRIFKISGRYFLNKYFNIEYYLNPDYYNKYIFKINVWDVSWDNFITKKTVIYFETRLWSFCSSLLNEYERLMPIIFNYMIKIEDNLEMSLYSLLDHNKIVEFDVIGVTGISADTGIIKIE